MRPHETPYERMLDRAYLALLDAKEVAENESRWMHRNRLRRAMEMISECRADSKTSYAIAQELRRR